jgi:hypothetical protein
VRYTLLWGRDNARRISSLDDLEGLLSFLATVRGQDGAPHGVDLLPAGAAGGGLQLGIGHPHRAFAIWLGAESSIASPTHATWGYGPAAIAGPDAPPVAVANGTSGGYAGSGAAGGYGIDDALDPWPEPIGFDCGAEVVDFKPAWTRVTPRQALLAAREYVLTGAQPTCLRFDPNA